MYGHNQYTKAIFFFKKVLFNMYVNPTVQN